MKPMNANELLAGLALARPVPITAVVTDSRKVQPGCIFVCFPGERVDSHDYAAKAYQAGAEYVIANHPVEGVPEDHLVICESSYLAMIRMASNYRTLFSPLMIGVTGSVGKTTTKEFCYAVLSAFGNTLKTEGNQNNEIGLPNTLFRLEDTTQYAVVEMGMSHLGEIARMVRAARQLRVAQGRIVSVTGGNGLALNAAHMPAVPAEVLCLIFNLEDFRHMAQDTAAEFNPVQLRQALGQSSVKADRGTDGPAVIDPIVILDQSGNAVGRCQFLCINSVKIHFYKQLLCSFRKNCLCNLCGFAYLFI